MSTLLIMPDQNIPESQKDKDWHIAHAMSYASYAVSNAYNDQRSEMLKLYRAYNAELSKEEAALAKATVCPHGYDLGIEYVVYPLIQSKIEQIVGEFITRPLRKKAYVMDKRSKNKKFQEKIDAFAEQIARELAENVQKDLGFKPETQNPNAELPENIEEHDFKQVAEEVADGLVKIFLDVRKHKDQLKNWLTDFCVTDRAHCVLEKKHGFTHGRKVHPLDCDYDTDPYKVVQDNHDFFFENYFLTENEIYNSFKLTETQKKEVSEMFANFAKWDTASYESEDLGFSQKYNGWFQTSNKVHRMRLISAMWKSRKKIRIKVSEGKEGNKPKKYYKKLDEDYKERSNDKVETIDGEMPHFVVMLGPEIVLDWGIMEKRYTHVDDPFTCFLPVISVVRDNTVGTSLIKSVAAKLYQLQQMASEILFEIRLALKQAGTSRVLVYDAAQTPKEFTKDSFETGLNRVMHHIKKDRLMIINSKQRGGGNSFNQFTSLDLSQKGAIQDLFNGLAIIEDLANKFVGITPEREGEVNQYQTATGTDKAIRGSFARTEVIYSPFDEFIQAILERVILKGRHDYEKGEVIHYIFGEEKSKFLTLFDEFFASDIGMYLSDSRRDQKIAESIDRAAEMALSNSNAPEMVMGLIEVFEGETANEKKKVFQKMLASMEELRQQQQEMAMQQQQQALAQEAADKEKDRGVQTRGQDKDIVVAQVYADQKSVDTSLKNASAEKIKAMDILKDKEKAK